MEEWFKQIIIYYNGIDKNWFKDLVIIFNYWILYYFLVLNTSYLLMTITAFREIYFYVRQIIFWDPELVSTSDYVPPISVLAPAYNEELSIIESVRALLALEYPTYEVVVINDGSKDRTMELLHEEYALVPVDLIYRPTLLTNPIRNIYVSTKYRNLMVIDKENGGKADALNAGINIIRYPLFCSIDADTLIEKEALLRVAKPMLEDSTVVATAGIVRVVNGSNVNNGRVEVVRVPFRIVPLIQVVEYTRAFLAGRTAWSAFNNLLLISGAFGLFRKDLVITVGGYSRRTVGEDMELVMKLHEYLLRKKIKYKIKFVADPVCWTEVPSTMDGLSRQRNRWQRGLIECLIKYRKMLLNPRYGTIGMVTVPYFWMFELIGPFIEFSGYIIVILAFVFGILNPEFFLLIMSVSVVYGTMISALAIILEEKIYRRYNNTSDILMLVLTTIIENFLYRQVTTYWRVKANCKYFWTKRNWGKSERKGFQVRTKSGAVG